ncbi:MAG TPA: DUF924 family protein [Rudaea sp.]|nr:DUF924 family protein [Rudaea sp.]
MIFKARVHRTHQHAIGQRAEAEVERCEQVRIGRRCVNFDGRHLRSMPVPPTARKHCSRATMASVRRSSEPSKMERANVANSDAVLRFWFEEATPQQHFMKDDAFDAAIRERFGVTHAAAVRCELSAWRDTAAGRLAEIIVLDQFSRNLWRDDARAFACDGMALLLAQEAIRTGADSALAPSQRAFLYMPFMHSESLVIHRQAVRLFDQPGLETNYDFELKHKGIIERFGRYPHRNATLGRDSTPEELAFLQQPDSSF